VADILAPQIADDEIVGLGRAEFRKLEIDTADPEAFAFQAADQMTADEPAGAADQRPFSDRRGCKLNLLELRRIRFRSCASIGPIAGKHNLAKDFQEPGASTQV